MGKLMFRCPKCHGEIFGAKNIEDGTIVEWCEDCDYTDEYPINEKGSARE
jgi:predicted nucleic-acid-binding Zn-ribbon protein